ncbi:TIGR03086 family metal-binding protein [Nocardioides sp.]|uniref:TIGR03086 family metal-binding protein n=1 Tax=Nocardioides sp. TaxID=35761 RepID=UPI0025FBDE45|nr:TIGR03086 family metal-binding protein [Nocardioides sp.]
MSAADLSPGEQHAYDAARFAEIVDFVPSAEDWARPSPVAAWTALDVVSHLVEWSRGFIQGSAGVELAPLDVADDPAAAWKTHTADVQALFDDPAGRIVSNPHMGDKPLDVALSEIYTPDIWMHSWDLSRALGRDFDLGTERAAGMLAGAAAMEDAMRASGQFGPRFEVPGDAPPQEQLLGFIGRDPGWTP